MGIKDNFSQAVKELWKNDRLDDGTEAPAAQPGVPTQLDQYLAQQDDEVTMPVTQPVQQAAAQTAQGVNAQPAQAAINQEVNAAGVPLETPYYRPQPQPAEQPQPAPAQTAQAAPQQAAPTMNAQTAQPQQAAQTAQGGFGGGYNNGGYGGGYNPPASGNVNANRAAGVTDEVTVISKNTVIDGNIRSLANMQVDGNIKGNVETTRDIDMTGKIVGDVTCNNASMNSAAMQGNISIKGKMRMDRDTILIGDLTSQYADVNGRIRGKLEIAGKAELKRDAIVFGDINASTIAVTDGAIIQGYVNTTFLSKEDSRNAFPDAISLDTGKEAGAK
ncbi:MAG: polymer-forming cytoskeletal protein [Ruminococcaceae bacterium]|nr:polymer-forming cytoskeletal protein [Oscillospiraceae bacterium]